MAHKILKIFNPTVVSLISGIGIDRPMNALTLTNLARKLFSEFTFAFEHTRPRTYRFNFVDPGYPHCLRTLKLPVTRTLYVAPDRYIDPPSVDILRIHAIIAKILHLRGASRLSIFGGYRGHRGGASRARWDAPYRRVCRYQTRWSFWGHVYELGVSRLEAAKQLHFIITNDEDMLSYCGKRDGLYCESEDTSLSCYIKRYVTVAAVEL